MARIAGVNIPLHRPIFAALRYVYGIGPVRAKFICAQANIDPGRRASTLTEVEVSRIREIIDANYKVEGDLRREVTGNIKRLVQLRCYRGLRHQRNLPTRGQRTHSNARTRRGRAKAIAGKKK